MNKHTFGIPCPLEAHAVIERNVRTTGAAYVHVRDDESGYANKLLAVGSVTLFGFIFDGMVFAYQVLPFGECVCGCVGLFVGESR